MMKNFFSHRRDAEAQRKKGSGFEVQGSVNAFTLDPEPRTLNPAVLCALACCLLFSLSVAWSADDKLTWSEDFAAELKAASADGQPVLVLLRHPADIGSLDAGHWLRENSLAKVLDKVHRVMLAPGALAPQELKAAPRAGLALLSPKGELLSVEEIPPLRAELEPALKRLLATRASPSPSSAEVKPDPDENPGHSRRVALERQMKGFPDDLKEQLRELLKSTQAAMKDDKKAEQRAAGLVKDLLARTMTRQQCLCAAGPLGFAIMELDLSEQRLPLAKKILKEAPVGRVAADAFLDLAENALASGAREEAQRFWKEAEKAAGDGESPTLFRAARTMRALADGKGPNESRWAERQVLDVVVLVRDLPSFAKAIARWDEKTFFPVLFEEDLYAPRFIAAFKPAQVVVVPASVPAVAGPGTEACATTLTEAQIRSTLLASWQNPDDSRKEPPLVHNDDELRVRLKAIGAEPLGVVVGDGLSGETAGGLALAAGRFQGFEFLPLPRMGSGDSERPAKPSDTLSRDAARAMMLDCARRLERWGLSREDTWAYLTLAAPYPFRYRGDDDGYKFGNTYALDDLLGRGEDSARIAVTGRLLGDQARSAYQAMCSLFLQPQSALLFNTYGLNPRSIWGAYRMDFSEAALKDRLTITHLKGNDASIATFRQQVFPWNKFGLITINSSGGATDWSVGGGGGTADDFPVGVPCAIHVTHSGSAADPYNSDTLAGRAIWGGAFWYFGSVAEPFLTAFQPPSYYGPLLAQGAPLAATFRKRSGEYFSWPWRLMIVGDPQFGLRRTAAERKAYHLRSGDKVVAADKAPFGFVPVMEYSLLIHPASALEHWGKTDEELRKIYAARIYARQAASSLLDRALRMGDERAMLRYMEDFLSTGPSANATERWLDKLRSIPDKKTNTADLVQWLQARADDEKLGTLRGTFRRYLCAVQLRAVTSKEKWSADDKAEALKAIAAAVQARIDAQQLLKLYDEFAAACCGKLPGATADSVATDVKALFAADSGDAKRLEAMFKELAKRKK
ncbi:MAG TPA: hypothetical protein VGP72_08240 [Planctomycetota bacterium]|jgi:hypothetical protein